VDQIIEKDKNFKRFMIKINRNDALYPGLNGGANSIRVRYRLRLAIP
jgi:hypothetical protein